MLVVSDDCSLIKAARNVPGIEVVPVGNLNAELLAPGTDVGRATLFTKSAIDKMETENLFARKISLPKASVKVE